MQVGLRKAQLLVDRYFTGDVPDTKPGKARGSEHGRYIQDVFTSLSTDDNGPLDSNPADNAVTYKDGPESGSSYVYSDTTMISGKVDKGRGVYDEYEFKGDLITQVSGRFYPEEGLGELYRTDYNLAEGTMEEWAWRARDIGDSNSADAFELTPQRSYLG